MMKNVMRKLWSSLFVFVVVTAFGADFVGTTVQWKGFEKVTFEVEGRTCWVVAPERAMAGKPWVWRARFPTYHTEVDELLLKQGYHVAYIDVANLFGSPQAVALWDAFYAAMVAQEFHDRVVLEGVSRGGLICYNWAKRNPDKVACMYLDAPVCDIKSWPGGSGRGDGSSADWQQAQQAYGLDEAALMAWDDNPIDHLEALAQAKVPVLHTISYQDLIVPPDENSLVLMKHYTEAGGPFSLYPVTQGEQTLQGHHYPVENPQFIVDFIISNSAPSKQRDYFELRGGIENARMVFERTGKGRVAFMGGSITGMRKWCLMVAEDLQLRFPATEFEFIIAGIPSTGSTPAAYRLTRDVFNDGPIDLFFEEAAVNDSTNGRTDTEQVRAMEGIVRHARDLNPKCDVVLLHFVDPDKMKTYNAGRTPKVIQNHERVAEHYQIASINLALEVTERIERSEFTWQDDFINLHPSPFGQKLYANTIKRMFDAAWPGEVAEDDKILSYKQPAKLDPFCYDAGQLISLHQAAELNGFRLDPSWKNSDGSATRRGFVDVPVLVGDQPNQSFSFAFKGSAVGLFVAAGPDAGIIEYRMDQSEWKTQDLFTPWSGSLHLPFLYVLGAALDAGKAHTLEVRVSDRKNSDSKGHACRVVHFAVNGPSH
jgi:sialidase-1